MTEIITLTGKQAEALARDCHAMQQKIRAAAGTGPPLPDWEQAEDWQRESSITSIRNAVADPSWTPQLEHERWYAERTAQGWTYGPVRDDARKINPSLVHYDKLPLLVQLQDDVPLLAARTFRAGLAAGTDGS